MAAIAQTIAIVDRSGKVVSTSKQLKNVFKEAKLAYRERKAEIKAERKAKEDRELNKALKAMSLADEERSNASRSRIHKQHVHRDGTERRRPSGPDRMHSGRSERSSYSDRSSFSESPRSRSSSRFPQHTPLGQFNEDLYGNSRSAPVSPLDPPRASNELVRRKTDINPTSTELGRRPPVRSYSATDMDAHIDMDLAYGEFHAASLALDPQVEQKLQKQEMSSLVLKCKMLMDEANCAQHSVKAIVSHLQKNPDAMAAVALTLAEISNLATKMAPGALMAFKSGAPAVFAILAAPEFLIAVGVGVGMTVVMFGGYKIIKKIKARAAGDKEDAGMDEMLEVGELDRIEHWRRGISDVETASVATSVEGEYITPMAAASRSHLPLPEEQSRSDRKDKKKKKHKDRDVEGRSDVSSERSSGSRRSKKLEVPGTNGLRDKALVKVKKPSPLRRMFNSRDTSSSVRS